jgi:outer membrane protein assembly factor BamA
MIIFKTGGYGILLSAFIAAILSGTAFASEADSLSLKDQETIKIDSVRIEGNDITKDFIILRELTFKEGDSVTGKTLRYNRERVFSLELFSRVDFILREINRKTVLLIRLHESWYIYPIPLARLQDGNIKKGTYGANILWKDFRGRNEVFSTSFGFGYNPYYSVLYQNPALDYANSIGIQLFFAWSKPTVRSLAAQSIVGYEYQNNVYSNQISVSKRINQFNLINFIAGFDYIEAPMAVSGITASGEKIDRSASMGISYFFDSRDLKQFSQNGYFVFVQLIHKGFEIDGIDYSLLDVDNREYFDISGDFSAKWRINYNSAFGKFVPFYDYSILGLYERIRGHFNELREGHNFLLSSFELSYPLIKEWDLHFKLPLIPEKLTAARIGIYLTGFCDTGAAYSKGSELSFNSFYSGYGLGFTLLILPYNAFRIEFARNELGRGEMIIGTGFSF